MNTNKNKYYKRSHISEGKFRHLLRCFAMDLNAYEAHQISYISHRSCKVIYAKLRLYTVKRCVGNRASTGTVNTPQYQLFGKETGQALPLA